MRALFDFLKGFCRALMIFRVQGFGETARCPMMR